MNVSSTTTYAPDPRWAGHTRARIEFVVEQIEEAWDVIFDLGAAHLLTRCTGDPSAYLIDLEVALEEMLQQFPQGHHGYWKDIREL
jgi:hypothetical protein